MAKNTTKVSRDRPKAEVVEGMPWKATLVNGETFYLGNKLFTKDKARGVTETEMNYLKDKAVDPVTVGNEGKKKKLHLIQKFEFTQADEVGAEAA